MRFLALSLLVGMTVATCVGCISHALHRYTTRLEQVDRAVIVRTTCNGQMHLGSGVIVSSTTVLTAMHVAPCQDATVVVTTRQGKAYSMRVTALAATADIARLTLSDENFGPVSTAVIARTYVGDTVCYAVAEPIRGMACGEVTRAGSGAHGIEHDGVTVAGNSGSGVYDSRGRLVGIVTQRHNDRMGGLATSLASRRWLVQP